ERITSPLTLTRRDFNKIWAQDLDHLFTLRCDRYHDGAYEDNYITGEFYKTDCQFDEDREIVRIEIDSVDRYKKILDGMDTEFDVIKDLMPENHTVRYRRLPLIQVAFAGHPYIWELYGQFWKLRDITIPTTTDLDNFGFTPP